MRWYQVLSEAIRISDRILVFVPGDRQEAEEFARRVGFVNAGNLLRAIHGPVFVETSGRGWVIDTKTGEAIDANGREATADLATTPRIVDALEDEAEDAASSLLARAALLAARNENVDVRELARVVFADANRADDVMTAIAEQPRDIAPALDALSEGAVGSRERRALARHGNTAAAKALEHGDVPMRWFEVVDAETALRTLDEAAGDGAAPEALGSVFDRRSDLAEKIDLPDGDGIDALVLAAADVSDETIDAVLRANATELLRDSTAIVRRMGYDPNGRVLLARLAEAAERRHLDALATALTATEEGRGTGHPAEDAL